MKFIPLTAVLSLALLPGLTMAQEAASPSGNESAEEPVPRSIPEPMQGSVPIESLIERVAMDMDEEFVIDPRIRGIMAYSTRESVDYESLLGILRVAGLVAIETGGQIHIMPEQSMRTAATRILQEDDRNVSDHEVVTRIIAVPQVSRTVRTGQGESVTETLQATMLVPILRPMMAQAAQLGAVPNTNSLVIVDRYDNVRRITAIIEEIVAGFED
ncbi:MAG TPA: hypothetical protein VMR74_11025 [Gammaproteobacteria bacterium]|nr:hypothetical protein [Gammaproteobacteria bacterium]